MDPKEQVARALQGQQPPTIMDRLGLSEYLPDWLYDRSTLDRTFPTGDADQSVFTNAANLVGRAPWELPYLAADVINSGEALLTRPVVSQDPEAPAHAMVMAGAAPLGSVAAKAVGGKVGSGANIRDQRIARQMEKQPGASTVDRMDLQRTIGHLRPYQRDSAADPRVTRRGRVADDLRFWGEEANNMAPELLGPVANNQRGFAPNVIKANPDDVTTGTVMDAVGRQTPPIRAYHGTYNKFDRFDDTKTPHIGPHFGTREQARQAAPYKGREIAVDLDMRRPLDMPDIGDWNMADVATALQGTDPALASAALRISQRGGDANTQNRAFRKAAVGRGYDGIRYANEFEGDGTSYIAIKPGTVKSADTGAIMYANPDDVTTGTVLDAVGRSVRDLPQLERMRNDLIERIDAARAEGWADTPAGEALRKQYLELTRNYNEALVRRSEQQPSVSEIATDSSRATITPTLTEGQPKSTLPPSTSSSQPASNTTVRAYHGTTRDIKGGRFNDDTFFSSSPDEAATYAGMYGGTGQNGRVYPVDIDTSGFATIDRRRNGRPVEWDDEFDMDVFTAIEEGAPGVVVKGIIDRSGASADQIIPARKGSVRSATTGDVLYANPSTATIMDMIARQLQEREMGEAYRRGDLT
jgi:hypothetical protein